MLNAYISSKIPLFLPGVYSTCCHLKPLRAKGWEKALLEFTAAILADSASESKPASARLSEISCPGNQAK